MTRDEFAALVAELRGRRPAWFALAPDARAEEATLKSVERALGLVRPDDFRWLLSEHGGGDLAFARIFSADAASDLFLPSHQRGLPDGVVAFAEDGTGDRFVFPVVDHRADDEILRLDHETGATDPTGHDGFLSWVADVAFRGARP